MKLVLGFSFLLFLVFFYPFVCQAQTDTIYIEEEYDTIIVEKPVIIQKQVIVIDTIPEKKYQLVRGLGFKVYGGIVYRYPCSCDDSITKYLSSTTGNESFWGIGMGYQQSIKKKWSIYWWNDVFRYHQKQNLLDGNLNSFSSTTNLWYIQSTFIGGYDVVHRTNKTWRLTILGGLGTQYLLNRTDFWPATSSQASAIAIKDLHRAFVLHATGQLLMTHVLTPQWYLQYGFHYQVDLVGPMKSTAPYYFYRNRMGIMAGLTFQLD